MQYLQCFSPAYIAQDMNTLPGCGFVIIAVVLSQACMRARGKLIDRFDIKILVSRLLSGNSKAKSIAIKR